MPEQTSYQQKNLSFFHARSNKMNLLSQAKRKIVKFEIVFTLFVISWVFNKNPHTTFKQNCHRAKPAAPFALDC
jgi:hypothetical protein